MALITKISTTGFDNTGRVLTIKDSTGVYNATDNPGGWGSPNLLPQDVQKIVFTVSYITGSEIGRQVYVRNLDPNHPEWNVIPSINNITAGIDIQITSLSLRLSTVNHGLFAFRDGVFDINMYDIFEEVPGVTGTEGNIYLTGIDFEPYYEADSVEVNGVLYDIDKSLPTNGYTVLYLTKPLEEDAAAFSPAYRANVKALNYAGVSCRVQSMAASLPRLCDDLKIADFVSKYRLVVDDLYAAQMNFECGNYAEADKQVYGSYKIANHEWGGCGC